MQINTKTLKFNCTEDKVQQKRASLGKKNLVETLRHCRFTTDNIFERTAGSNSYYRSFH